MEDARVLYIPARLLVFCAEYVLGSGQRLATYVEESHLHRASLTMVKYSGLA